MISYILLSKKKENKINNVLFINYVSNPPKKYINRWYDLYRETVHSIQVLGVPAIMMPWVITCDRFG